MLVSLSAISRGRSPSIRTCSASRSSIARLSRAAAPGSPAAHLQVHLILYPTGSFRTGNIAAADCHFAFRTDDFDGALATLTANGFREDAAEDDPMRVMVRRDGPAGFPQLFILDPDRNIIEINGAP